MPPVRILRYRSERVVDDVCQRSETVIAVRPSITFCVSPVSFDWTINLSDILEKVLFLRFLLQLAVKFWSKKAQMAPRSQQHLDFGLFRSEIWVS